LFTKDPYGYGTGARCDECKTDSCIDMGYLFHCPICKYDLCNKCEIVRNANKLDEATEEELNKYLS